MFTKFVILLTVCSLCVAWKPAPRNCKVNDDDAVNNGTKFGTICFFLCGNAQPGCPQQNFTCSAFIKEDSVDSADFDGICLINSNNPRYASMSGVLFSQGLYRKMGSFSQDMDDR